VDRVTWSRACVALTLLSAASIVGVVVNAARGVTTLDPTSVPRACVTLTPLRHVRVEAVVRHGRLIRSVTVRAVGGTRVYGCDSTGVRVEGRVWCNLESGVLRRGRVRDPRLGLLCRARDGRRVATAWINAVPHARTLIVADGPHCDRYGVVGGLPIRVATTHGIRYARAEATFSIAQYDARGRLLTKRRFVARVAG
jgi:hypothetical protein